jgi:hypothetical protein
MRLNFIPSLLLVGVATISTLYPVMFITQKAEAECRTKICAPWNRRVVHLCTHHVHRPDGTAYTYVTKGRCKK